LHGTTSWRLESCGAAKVVVVDVLVDVGAEVLTPLLQTSFLPLRTHVYFIPAKVVVFPLGEQVVPGFIAADETFEKTTKEVATRISAVIRFIMED
jgi:hypothetical protein